MPSARRRRGLAAVIVVALIVLVVWVRLQRGPQRGDDWTRYHDRTFRVADVLDGDTIQIEVPDEGRPVTKVRLWGVDAPEIAHGKEPDAFFGPEAKAFAQATLAGREVHIVLSPGRTRGKYGRLLAYVYLQRGGRMFNEMLLEEGYAYADLRFPHLYDKRFRAIEKRARRDQTGLWANVSLSDMPAWKRRFEIGD